MSSQLGKSIMSKTDSVNTVSSTSELMLPPLSRLPKKTCRFVAPSVPVDSIENVRKRKRTLFFRTDNSIGLSNLEFSQWVKKQVFFLNEVWEKNKFEEYCTTSKNALALLVEAIDIDEELKIKWIVKNLRFMYKEKRKKLKEQSNEEIANILSIGSNNELKETVLRFLINVKSDSKLF